MKHLPRILSMMVVLTSISAFADSASYTNLNANFYLGPNYGVGDNIGGTIVGPGVNLTWGGGTPFSWFNNMFPNIPPGSGGGGGTTIYPDLANGTIGSQSFSGGFEVLLYAFTFNAGEFTFPANGQQNFTVTVPASMGLIYGEIDEYCPNNICEFTLATGPGQLTLSYSYISSPFGSGYYGVSGYFTTTPEPGTFGLIAIGMGAVAWCWRQQKWV